MIENINETLKILGGNLYLLIAITIIIIVILLRYNTLITEIIRHKLGLYNKQEVLDFAEYYKKEREKKSPQVSIEYLFSIWKRSKNNKK